MPFIAEEMDYMDKVKNKYNGVVGRIIAIYMDEHEGVLKTFLNVRTDRRIHHNTPAFNWELIEKNI